jgi:hypothetical protein
MNRHNRCSIASFPAGLLGVVMATFAGCSGDNGSDVGISTEAVVTGYASTFQDGTNGYSGTTDSQLRQANAGANYGTATALVADGDEPAASGNDSSIVLRWDVSSIPTDATVTSVSLGFRVTNSSRVAYPIYPLLRGWTESSVTWNNASSETAWQTAGAMGSLDRGTTSIGSLSAAATGTVTVNLNSAGISAVQSWITNPSQNFGIIITSPSNTDGLDVYSSEYTTVAYRPKLTVNYTRATNPGTGGAGTGGAATGGAATGGAATGGAATGGAATGGAATGGTETGGSAGSSVATQLLAVSDIADCSVAATGRNGTASLLDGLFGPIVTMGDANNGDGTLATYNSCFAPAWGRHKSRIRPVPGNHDYFVTNAQGFVDYFTTAVAKPNGKTYYSYDVGDWHLIALDGNCTKISGGCSAGGAQETWLRQDLAAHTGNHCALAYFHQPRFTSGEHGSNSSMQPIWKALADNGVELVLSGHDHDYERFNPMDGSGALVTNGKGVMQFVVGTGGASLRSFGTIAANSAVRIANTYGLLKLNLRSSGYDWAFVPIAGGSGSDSGSRGCYDP